MSVGKLCKGIGSNPPNLEATHVTWRASSSIFFGVAAGPTCKMFCRDMTHTCKTPAASDRCASCWCALRGSTSAKILGHVLDSKQDELFNLYFVVNPLGQCLYVQEYFSCTVAQVLAEPRVNLIGCTFLLYFLWMCSLSWAMRDRHMCIVDHPKKSHL